MARSRATRPPPLPAVPLYEVMIVSEVRPIEGDPNEFWDEFDWSDLTSDEQFLWASLGWDEGSWDEETEPPESNDLYWEDLTASQKAALKQLGYTQRIWDEEDD